MIWVGERDGCTFHMESWDDSEDVAELWPWMLEWEVVDQVIIPNWRGIFDELRVYRRKSSLQQQPLESTAWAKAPVAALAEE